MKQSYFIVVLAHSVHGRLRRIQIPQQVIYAILALAVLGSFSVVGFVSSYARMAWKVANYNALRREADSLRARYQNLEKVAKQTNEQLATLQLFASEVSVAYGIKKNLEGPSDIVGEGRLVPTFVQTLAEYNYLRTTNFSRFRNQQSRLWSTNIKPSIWPVYGRLLGPFGQRTDPFSGEGAIHTGVDIAAPTGTTVRATGDGMVIFADRNAGYGRLVVVDHGGGVQSYYAHLSRYDVIAGQSVRRGDAVGGVGASGRVTGTHLHYEVRVGGAPMNPIRFLQSRSAVAATAKKDFPF